MTSLDPARRLGKSRHIELALLGAGLSLLAVWTLFHHLGADSLADWDEATYAQIAREMLRTGQWITPVWNGHAFYDKPPLVFWLMSASMSMVASPELAVRLAPAICGVVTIALTAWLAHRMFGGTAAVVAGIVLLVGAQNPYGNFARLARQGMLDVPLTACTVWAVCHFYRGVREPRAWRLIGAPLGLAFMVKSFAVVTPIVVLAGSIPLLPFVGITLSREHWRSLGIAALVAVAIILPWHVAQLAEHGRAFVHSYVMQNVIEKVTSAGAHQEAGRLFYVRALAGGLPGWSWLILPAAVVALWRLLVERDVRALILLIWIAVPLVLFNLAQSKLPWYILPVYPAIAMMIAALFELLVPRSVRYGVVALLLAATAAWNVRALAPLQWTYDARQMGRCVQTLTRADETVAFFDHEGLYQFHQRDFWNIRPAALFYADRTMVALVDRPGAEAWLRKGGVWLWAEGPGAGAIADLFEVAARRGPEVLLKRPSGQGPGSAADACAVASR